METQEYKRWLSSGVSNREVIETLQVSHSAWDDLYVANSDRQLLATLEDGLTQVSFIAGRFYWEPPETTDTMAQSTTIAVSSLEGRLYDKVKSLGVSDRDEPIQLVHRLYFADDPSEPLIAPPPIWYVHGIEATREALKAEVLAVELRVRRIGLYYTQQEFPAVVYL